MAKLQLDQQEAIDGFLRNIDHQSGLMKLNLADNNILQALKHCSNFLNELRTSQLSPKQYYELYIAVFESLETLSSHLLASHASKLKKKPNTTPFLADLYELVQYSGNIIPRLYMMVVIGTTYMATENAPVKEIMKDMIEMCRGVQHPIRGLFLRYYLSQRAKELLPISNETDFSDTVKFLVTNFIEMNKLWVRLQHQGHSSEREIRYRERKELKILVGSNLVRLSQVIDDYYGNRADPEEASVAYYKENVFPVITKQIIQCRDHLAQAYLVDVLIQIFPESFHFATLDQLLNQGFLSLHPLLKKSDLVASLVDRFLAFHRFEDDDRNKDHNKDNETHGQVNEVDDVSEKVYDLSVQEAPEKQLFNIFWKFYLKLLEVDPDIPPEEDSVILQSLIRLILTYNPDDFGYLDHIYQQAIKKLQRLQHPENLGDNAPSKVPKFSEEGKEEKLWLQLMAVPIDHLSSVRRLLQLPYFYEFYLNLSSKALKKEISMAIVNKILSAEASCGNLSTIEDIDCIFKYLLVLIKDEDFQVNTAKSLGVTKTIKIRNGELMATQQFLNEQELISKVIHLINHGSPYKCLANLMYVRKKYLNKNKENIIFTYPALINRILHNLRIAGFLSLKAKERDPEKQLAINGHDQLINRHWKNLSVILDELYTYNQQHSWDHILTLYLDCASVADQMRQLAVSYELYTQCFVLFEENWTISSGQQQHGNTHDSLSGSIPYHAIVSIANKLAVLRYLSRENYESLITKATLYASKLLKKHDQCRSVYLCAHLWWWCELYVDKSPTVTDNKEVEKEDNKAKTGNKETQSKDVVKESDQEYSEQSPEKELFREPKRVLECLQKALRIADSCMDPYLSLRLFVEIFGRCIIFNIYGNPLVDARYMNGLIDLIKTNLDNLNEENMGRDADDSEYKHYLQISGLVNRTIDYIADQQDTEGRLEGIMI